MRALAKKFLALPRTSQRLLLQSVVALCSVRVGLSLMSLTGLLKLHKFFASRRARNLAGRRVPFSQVTWAVAAAGRAVPGMSNCLIQALAAMAMLNRQGYSVRLCIGVGKQGPLQLDAHAWVEMEGNTIMGQITHPVFTRLFTWDGVKT